MRLPVFRVVAATAIVFLSDQSPLLAQEAGVSTKQQNEVESSKFQVRNELISTIKSGGSEALRKMLAQPVYLAQLDPPMLDIVAKFGNEETIEVISSTFFDVDAPVLEHGWTLLMLATQEGNSSVASALLNLGAEANMIGEDGATFLSLLVNSSIPADNSTTAGELKRRVVDQLATKNKDTLLVNAASAADRHMVATLLGLGANANTRDQSGNTPFIRAAISGEPLAKKVLEDLINIGGADPNITNFDGSTALALAIAGSVSGTIMDYLISVSDMEFRHSNGSSYWDIARGAHNNFALVKLPKEPIPPPPDLVLPRGEHSVGIGLKRKMSRIDWVNVQEYLAYHGLYNGGIDGIPGNGTKNAAIAYLEPLMIRDSKTTWQYCYDLHKWALENGLSQEFRLDLENGMVLTREVYVYSPEPKYAFIFRLFRKGRSDKELDKFYCSFELSNTPTLLDFGPLYLADNTQNFALLNLGSQYIESFRGRCSIRGVPEHLSNFLKISVGLVDAIPYGSEWDRPYWNDPGNTVFEIYLCRGAGYAGPEQGKNGIFEWRSLSSKK